MRSLASRLAILIADDDPDDRLFIREGFEEAHLEHALRFVEDGEQLMDYLFRRGDFATADEYDAPTPGLIMIDLNMPKKDGREALREIKNDPVLRRIPVVILTTSSTEEDIARTYEDGVNSFITKPVSFEKLVDVILAIEKYWFETVQLPPRQ